MPLALQLGNEELLAFLTAFSSSFRTLLSPKFSPASIGLQTWVSTVEFTTHANGVPHLALRLYEA